MPDVGDPVWVPDIGRPGLGCSQQGPLQQSAAHPQRPARAPATDGCDVFDRASAVEAGGTTASPVVGADRLEHDPPRARRSAFYAPLRTQCSRFGYWPAMMGEVALPVRCIASGVLLTLSLEVAEP